MKRELSLVVDGVEMTVLVERRGDRIVVERDGEEHQVVVTGDRFVADDAPRSPAAAAPPAAPQRAAPRPAPSADATAGDGAGVTAAGEAPAPMVGVVREIHVRPGDRVAAGDRLVTMEAMKMDIYVTAPVDGEVTSVLCSVGDTTNEGAVLATVGPADGERAGAGLDERPGPA